MAAREPAQAAVDQVWSWLAEVEDPEIPVISIVDLGIVRDVAFDANGVCTVTITPTYSGCPATEVIAASVSPINMLPASPRKIAAPRS